jgi:hypothetical protein
MGSASLVSLQRFRGRLGGRQGTFVLQGEETQGEFGRGSEGTLEYWFE